MFVLMGLLIPHNVKNIITMQDAASSTAQRLVNRSRVNLVIKLGRNMETTPSSLWVLKIRHTLSSKCFLVFPLKPSSKLHI